MTFARVRALIFVAVLFVTAGVVVLLAIDRDSQTRTSQASDCASGLVPAKVRLPERSEVTLNIFNGTKTNGLAERVGQQLKDRGFVINKIATAPRNRIYPNDVAIIIYGPQAVGAAQLVRANFLLADDNAMRFNIERETAEVDVILGEQFQQLATSIEVNQAIAQLGTPDPPPGTCAVD